MQALPAVVPGRRSLSVAAALLLLTVASPPAGGAARADEPPAGQPATGAARPGQVAQPGGPARDTPEAASGTARIRGVVVAAETGVPLRRAIVRVDAREIREGRTTTTDADGRYEIKDIPAGRYTVSVSKGGYVSLQYGQRRAFEQGRPLEVRDAQSLDGVNFALPRGGVITGRIVDEFGEPVADAMVSGMRFQYFRGRRRLMPTGRGASTNDLGQFRLYGLAPGDYYISAVLRNVPFFAEGMSEISGYAPTYYPGSPSSGDAQRISVAVGQEAVADFALVPARLVRVTGSVLDSTGRPVTEGMVRLVPRNDQVGGSFMGQVAGRVREDGTFTVGGVAPGSYTASVNTGRGFGGRGGGGDDDVEFGSVPITVGNDDLGGVLISTTKGGTAAGHVVIEEGAVTVPLSGLRVFASPASLDDEAMMFGPGGGGGRVNDDGTFELRGLVGRRLLNVAGGGPTGAGASWRLKAVYLGNEEVTDSGFEVRGAQRLTGLQVVLTTQITEISGTAADSRGRPLKDYVVIVFAEDEARWTHPLSRYTRSARPDQDGKYSVTGLPPGDYLAVAVDSADQGAIGDPDLLGRLRDAATTVRLGEGEKKALTLTLAPQ